MLNKLPPDPSLADLQVYWESQYWDKARSTWRLAAGAYELMTTFFGKDRKPRDIFRADVAEFKTWLTKKGYAQSSIVNTIHYGSMFYKLLDDLELVEYQFNPFASMAPRRIRSSS